MKKNRRILGFLVLTALFFTSCETAEKEEVEQEDTFDMEMVRTEIQAMEDAYAAGEKAKDADAVAAYYSDDAISYGQNKEPLSGKAAIRANIAKKMAKDTTDNYSVFKIVDLYAEGNMAVEIGSWTQMDSNGKALDNGNYMSYFEKRDGKYVCVRDMSTTATPLKSGM
jgi:ketosteroid isomerase-like protein|tara:strand:- start:19115 stop:19618 length:504 start_codon:yes stop_codon:yes gene_type:complete